MSQYLAKLDRHLGNIQHAATEEADPHRSRILWNYLHHGAFELGGDWERIFTPEMIVDEPHYEMGAGVPQTVVLDGQEAVEEFYAMIEGENLMLIDDGNHQLFVNDDGLAEFATTVEFASGEAILAEGTDHWFYDDPPVDDPAATYVKTCRHAMFWPYDGAGRLIGETVYQVEPFEVRRADPDAVPTLEAVAEVAKQYYPEHVDGPTPFAAADV